MSSKQLILARFGAERLEHPLFLADLDLWYAWHSRQGTLPSEWKDTSLLDISRALGGPVWESIRPWQMEYSGVNVVTQEDGVERLIRYETPVGTLSEKWSLGPDGDWWQIQYPAKTGGDIPAARMLIQARSFIPNILDWNEHRARIGDDGVLAIEIPQCPYSNLLHTLLGWSEGLMLLLGDQRPAILEILDIMQAKTLELIDELVQLPGELILAPDNLDGQFISPPDFKQHLSDYYRRLSDAAHQNGKYVVVHVGGPCKRLLPLLAEAGVDGVEGIAAPPQSDVSLAEARQAVGPNFTLWGGIAQDYLLAERSQAEFEAAVRDAVQQARKDARTILGVADRVPVAVQVDRLCSLPHFIQEVWEKG